MRRGRAPSRTPSGSGGPVWDNPDGQLPGTGIPGDGNASPHRGSNLWRRRDASPVPVTVAGTSGGGVVEGQVGASVGAERPSLFSMTGSSSFTPFSTALASLSPDERLEADLSGASMVLQRYANREMQRLFEERLRNMPPAPLHEVVDDPRWADPNWRGSAGGTAQVFHIGTPSASEHTATEGNGSSLFQSIPSQRTSTPSHPTSSPVSFGPSTPVRSASAAPEGLMSSPGLMSDVGGILNPPGLPLSDPPRVAGTYGISLSDPIFGMSSGSLPCDNPGRVPIPVQPAAQTPVRPSVQVPPPPPTGAGDPFAQILVGQSAMSTLMLQMAQEMSRRAAGNTGNPATQAGDQGNQGGNPGSSSDSKKEMRMDEKWIPSMPAASWKSWSSRSRELSGFKGWLEQFSGWLCLIHDAYGPELREAINSPIPISQFRNHDQSMRSKRLFHLLQQNFSGYSKIENIIKSQIAAWGITESNGFELLRLIRKEFSLLSRSEALGYREQCVKFRVKKTDHLPDIVREVQTEIESFHSMLDASIISGQLRDVRISEGDQFLLYMRNLPAKVQEFLQLHQNATTVQQLFIGVQDYYIRTRVQGDMGSIHVAQPLQKPDVKDKTCFNCGKKGHLAENCPEPKKCSHCGKKGHVAKDCWEKHPDRKPKAKAKAQPSKPFGKDKKPTGRGTGRGKGGRKAKGRGKGNKFRGVDEEGDEDDQDYDDEYEDDQGDDNPEPEADPSAGGSVNQIHEQITMCVKGQNAGTSRTERPVTELHRVDEINLSEKFQSIGVGDPKRRSLADSGATCHIISERWLSSYKVLYPYEVGIPVLKGAGDNVLPTRGMVDLECKVGQIKVTMRKVVICALDINVLSSYALHEQGWETRLGTLKVSGLYHKKVKFPLKIADRAWWLEVQILKPSGHKSRRRKDQGLQDMEVDCVKSVSIDLSPKACQPKDVATEVGTPGEQSTMAPTSENPVLKTEVEIDVSEIPHMSKKENVGRFNNMRKECQIKSFDGLGPFSYVCRMVKFEPNTTETLTSETGEGDFDVYAPQLGTFVESLTESCIGDRHYVCAVGEVSHERVLGFPVKIDIDVEEPQGDEDEDDGYAPTPEGEEVVPLDSGERREWIPENPVSEESEDFEEPQLLGNLLRQHEARGHWPYDKGCDSCVQARGRTPARRRRHQGGHEDSPALISMAADLTFIAGRHWRILVILMIHTGMLGMVVITGDRENDIKSTASVLNEIGVGGLSIEVATDNENYLVDLVSKGLAKSNARSFHWRNISEYRPQAKGIERAVCISKEGIYTNWLAFEEHCQCRIALESPLLGYLVGYVYRTFDMFCEQRQSGTPLEKMRGARGAQKPSSHPFGVIGFVKPVLVAPWKGQRMVLCTYLGMRYVTGGGVLAFPLNQDSNGQREVIRGHSFRTREGVQYDVNAVWPLLSGVRPNDPNVAPPFVDPREALEGEPQVEEGVLDDVPEFPMPSRREDVSVPAASLEDIPAAGSSVEDERMDVDLRGDDDDDMDLGMIDRLDHCIHWYHQDVWNEFASQESCMVVGSKATSFTEQFGGIDIQVEVPHEVNDELTGLPLDHQQVVEGMKTEVKQLEALKVGRNMTETEARKMSKEKNAKIWTSRWVNTQKNPTLARCRLVVRDFASGAESAFRSGIYAPTSSLDSLRCVLALAALWDLWLITADVSTAFMYAEVEEDACDLVLLPSNISYKGERVVCLLFKAMNGLRRAPLLWFYQLQRTVYKLNGEDTFESTLFRLSTKRGLVLILVYVDDLLIASQDQTEGEKFLQELQSIWKMKVTGRILRQKKGALEFLGRTIYRSKDGESALYFGVNRQYMVGIFESWGESVKAGGTGLMPKLEDVHKEAVKKFGEEPLTGAAEQRYRRVLGQLAWAALSRADLSFPISFLSRFQAKPNPAAEHCMRTFLKWLVMHLHFVQRMPAAQCPYAGEPKEIVSFCDASWGLDSVSGAIIIYKGCCIKFFSRKQDVPALSSAEAEIISIVETAKEMVSIGMLLQTVIQGIPLDPLGMPQQTTGEMGLRMFNDAKAAISMGKMDGLLRRVRHLELRVKYCQHLHKTRKLSLTHWKGEENPADGLTKSSKPLSLWTNLVEAVGLVPGPKEAGSAWIRNFLRNIQQEQELDSI